MRHDLVALHTGPTTPGGFTDPFEMLGACHERIRTFAAVARRLATETAPASQVADAARRLHLYFGTALPLHEQDEEETLSTALAGGPESGRSDLLFERLRREHREIEHVVGDLLPRWDAVARRPERVVHERTPMLELTEALSAAFAPHLAMEEEELFALARRSLPADRLVLMLAEMRGRRQPVFAKLQELHRP